MTTLDTLISEQNDIKAQIAGIKVLYPYFHNGIVMAELPPDAIDAFSKFIDLRVIEMDYDRKIKRAESRQNRPPRSTRTNGLAVRGLNLNPSFQINFGANSEFILPPIRRSLSDEMRTLTLSPISDSGSVHSPRSELHSPEF